MILGCEKPRIYTLPARTLTKRRTEGYDVIAFAETVFNLRLFPWQKWMLIHGLEFDASGHYRYRTVVVTVARQSGKTLLMIVLALYHIYVKDSRTVIGTAQDLANSEKAWAEAVELAQSERELDELIERITLAHPKSLKLVTGCEYRVATASRRGGRGFSADLVLLDELREHQSWDSWAAVTYTMQARPKAQAWGFSNAGDSLSVVLRYLRASAHQSLGWPDGDADKDVLGELDGEGFESGDEVLGWFEWSAPPSAKRNDPTAWAQAIPSLNHTDIIEDCPTERTITASVRTSPPEVVETEVMCRWTSLSDAGPWPEGSWAATIDAQAKPAAGADSVVCLDLNWSRSTWSIARAALDEHGNPVAGIAAQRAGSEWVLPWLLEQRGTYSAIILPTSSGTPALSLLDQIEEAELPLTKWHGADVGAATGQLFDLLRDSMGDGDHRPRIRHLPHPGLDAAATTAAVKPLQAGGWVIDRVKSPTDAAPLQAFIGAVWGLMHKPDDNMSVYSRGEDVLVLN